MNKAANLWGQMMAGLEYDKELIKNYYIALCEDIKKQKEIVTLIKILLEEKQKLYPPGAKLDPSTVQNLCCSSN